MYEILDKNNAKCKGLYFIHYREVYGVIRRSADFFVAAVINDDVVGCIGISNHNSNYFMLYIIVHPDHRRKGIASRLIENSIEYIKDDAKSFTARVEQGEFPLEVFYKFGFQYIEKLKSTRKRFSVLELNMGTYRTNNK